MLLAFFCCHCSDSNSTNNGKANSKTAIDSLNDAAEIFKQKLIDLSSSKNMADILCQGWELEEDLEALTMSNDAMGMQPFRSFYLSADSTYVKDPRNVMEYGQWKFDNTAKTITLNRSTGEKDVYKIGALASNELIAVNNGLASVTKLKYVSGGKRYRNASDDPWHISNNRWRIKPAKPETDEAIRQRVKEFIYFHILFYRDNIARDKKVISFYGIPTCLKWYAGGIIIIKKDELPANWFDCFYNKAQAMKGYGVMDDVIGKKYKWTKGQASWVKKNLAVLEQMYQKI